MGGAAPSGGAALLQSAEAEAEAAVGLSAAGGSAALTGRLSAVAGGAVASACLQLLDPTIGPQVGGIAAAILF